MKIGDLIKFLPVSEASSEAASHPQIERFPVE